MSERPLFSIIHPSARPDQWRKVYDDWTGKCANPSDVEYILVADERWGFDGHAPKEEGHAPYENLRVKWNTARRCYVDAVNEGAKHATGTILIVIADDQFACDKWDEAIAHAVEFDAKGHGGHGLFVVEVSTGTPQEHERGILVLPILSRGRYERLGYVFYPEYESMYADNDFCSHARKDGIIIDARHLMFPHKHPMVKDGKWDHEFKFSDESWDAAYRAQNGEEAYRAGKQIFEQRRAHGFSDPGQTPLRLNLGCSDRLEDGFLNVDLCELADVTVDLRGDWPWIDSSVSEIRAHDIIEHLPDAIHTMNEAFRVLKPGGRFDIIVPTTEGRGAWQDPTHKSFWNRNSFFYFEHGNPHLHRFEKAYGVKCAFRIASEQEQTFPDGVTKLHILLEAVKDGSSQLPEGARKEGAESSNSEQSPAGVAHPRETLAICYPGEHFSSEWVTGFLKLYTHLIQRFQVQLCPCYTSNVYHTRMQLAEMLIKEPNKPDFVLWIDDDNIAEPQQFDQLYLDLLEFTDVDVMFGWCWIHFTQQQKMFPSCGNMDEGKQLWHDGAGWSELKRVVRVDWSGFPFALMRYQALEKAGGAKAWLPIMDERYTIGMSGEDIAWCIRAAENGMMLAADPRVRVHHMKTVAVEPVLPSKEIPAVTDVSSGVQKGTAAPKIAGMLRVKNESRWIKRVIESLMPLCDAGVFVMDDGSTDETRELCRQSGAEALPSPFQGELLNEARDKNWLMERILNRANPDWILCIDGDEELVSCDIPLIRKACESAAFDCYTLQVLYLWDSPNQWRVDGPYSDMKRHSLFRPRKGMEFKSLYQRAKQPVHTGLHVSNAPVWRIEPSRTGKLPARLLHYGYLDRQDRIRKFEWYTSIDPGNEIEDSYRHIVVGDLPELPANTVTKHAGPLQLEPLRDLYVQPLPEIEGWMTPAELQWLFEQAKGLKMVAEIGAWKGRSTHALLSAGPIVHTVDTWKGSDSEPAQQAAAKDDAVYWEFALGPAGRMHAAEPQNLFVHRMRSIEAARNFLDGTFDLVFIDGEHTYEAVKADIEAWLPKVKDGGLICGHDRDSKDVANALGGASIWHWQEAPGSLWSYRVERKSYVIPCAGIQEAVTADAAD